MKVQQNIDIYEVPKVKTTQQQKAKSNQHILTEVQWWKFSLHIIKSFMQYEAIFAHLGFQKWSPQGKLVAKLFFFRGTVGLMLYQWGNF